MKRNAMGDLNKHKTRLKNVALVLNIISLIVIAPFLIMLISSVLMLLFGLSINATPGSLYNIGPFIYGFFMIILPFGFTARISAFLINKYLVIKDNIRSSKFDIVFLAIYIFIFFTLYYSALSNMTFS